MECIARTDVPERLAQIGLVMESAGINIVELAEKLKAHVASSPGGQKCIQALLTGEK
jgi:thiamine pyrophosphate-dependent acetolactate synthase large subunit-like protein